MRKINLAKQYTSQPKKWHFVFYLNAGLFIIAAILITKYLNNTITNQWRLEKTQELATQTNSSYKHSSSPTLLELLQHIIIRLPNQVWLTQFEFTHTQLELHGSSTNMQDVLSFHQSLTHSIKNYTITDFHLKRTGEFFLRMKYQQGTSNNDNISP